jgi:4-hydroxybenzoyl-CoA reductase subunit beta
MKQGIFTPKYLVHLGALPDLDKITFDEQSGLRIGALTKLHSIEKDPIILKRYPVIGQAAKAVGSAQLRQMGTLAGNLCLDTRCHYYNQSDYWRKCMPTCLKMGGEKCNAVGGGKKCFAVFSGDVAPALIALGAKIKIISAGGERILPLTDLYTGDGAKPHAIKPDEILVGVEVPAIPSTASAIYLKYRIRKSIDFPLASVATMLTLEEKEKTCREAKVVIGAVGMKPQEVNGIGKLLNGKKIADSLIEEASELAYKAAKPIANIGDSSSGPSYRKRMIKHLVMRSLQQYL